MRIRWAAWISLALCWPVPGRAQDELAGAWSGTWTRSGDTLAVDMRFERTSDGWRGSFDADRLRVVGIPFTDVAFVSPRVAIRMVGDATTLVFEGVVRGDSLTGTLQEAGDTGTFAFARADLPAISEEEVAFANGDVRLAGSLLLPSEPGPHPAVVFAHGSGAEGRWASRYLARRLALAGWAALIFDKRGVGGSGGDWRAAGLEDLAGDVRAGARYLAGRPDIDARRIGIHGHSQGGTLAPLIATGDAPIAFVIASAAGGLPTDEIEIYSVMNSIEDSGLPPEDEELARSYVEELVAVAYRGANRARLDSLTARARGRPWFFEPPPPESGYWGFSRQFGAYDPLSTWRRVHVPVLLLYGGSDRRVPPAASAEAIVAALGEDGSADVTVRIFPGADHTFRVRGAVWPRTVEGYPDAILDWLAMRSVE